MAERVFDNKVTEGEDLAAAARMVGDVEDFSMWRSTRQRWTRETAQALRQASLDDALARFERVTKAPSGGGVWADDLPRELGRVQEGLRLLRSLADNNSRR
jgi:hypothetical protein